MKGMDRGTGSICGALLLGALLAGCAGGEAATAEAGDLGGRVISVEVVELQPELFTEYLPLVARVEANREVVISAEEAGVIRELLAEKGSRVAAGQPIARIDDRVLRPQAEQAAKEAELAQELWERQRRLWEEDRVGSEMAYLQARYRAETTRAGALALSERLERTLVRAPFTGVLDGRAVEVGALVGPGAAIGRILDVSTVRIAAGVPERYAGQIRVGAEVTVLLDGFPESSFSGTVGFVGASVDQGNRTFPIEVRVPNPGGVLKPGMIATLRLARAQLPGALVVPQEAVLRFEGGYLAFVATGPAEAPRAEARPVQLGASQANRVVILEGLEPGERVIVVGQNRVAQGDRIEVVTRTAGGGR